MSLAAGDGTDDVTVDGIRGCPTVLVVDDDLDFREALVLLLLRYGYRTVPKANGAEALSWLLSASPEPCLVLLDLMMPVMNGFELYTRMRGDPRLAAIPVVVLTGAPTLERRAQEEIGAQVLHKPMVATHLLGVVDRYCRPTAPS